MSHRVRVYIASPYTNGNKEELVKNHFEVAYHLLKMGFNPYAPLYCHYIQKEHPDVDSKFPWLEIDKEWLRHCDIAIRMHFTNEKGEEIPSPGADEEEDYCDEHKIPMFHFETIEEMIRTVQTFNNRID